MDRDIVVNEPQCNVAAKYDWKVSVVPWIER